MENKNIDLNIYPVRDDSDDAYKLVTPVHPNLPDLRRNFVLCLCAPRHSGKTTLYSNLLLRKDMFNAPENCPGGVFIFSPTIMSDLTAKWIREIYPESIYPKYEDSIVKDIITMQESYPPSERPKIMIIIDDSIGVKTPYLSNLASRSRHWNCCLLFSVQNFKQLNKTARANLSDVVLGMTYNHKQLEDIYEELGCLVGTKKRFMKLFKYACNKKYSMLYMKLDKNPCQVYKNFTEDITHLFPEKSIFDKDELKERTETVQQGHDTNTETET